MFVVYVFQRTAILPRGLSSLAPFGFASERADADALLCEVLGTADLAKAAVVEDADSGKTYYAWGNKTAVLREYRNGQWETL